MKLFARTPNNTGIGLTVILTGQVREEDGLLTHIEVILPIGCDLVVARADYTTIEPLPKSPMGQQLLWVHAGDLCADDGMWVNQAKIRAEIVRVNDQRRLDMARGPLGENWP